MLADRRYCCPFTITDFASRLPLNEVLRLGVIELLGDGRLPHLRNPPLDAGRVACGDHTHTTRCDFPTRRGLTPDSAMPGASSSRWHAYPTAEKHASATNGTNGTQLANGCATANVYEEDYDMKSEFRI
jgi:hypothetical protein